MKTKIYLFFTALIITINIQAQSLTTIDFPEDQTLPPVGNTFTLPISGASIPTFYTLTIVLDIDTAVVDYLGFTNATAVPVNVVQNEGRLTATFGSFPTQSTLADGLFLTLDFKFLGGNSPFTFFVDQDTPPLGCNYLNLSFVQVAITSVTSGNINGGFAPNTISSGTWATATDWSQGVVPNSFHNVTVDGGVVSIGEDAVANSVIIANGGQLTQNAALTVTGDFTVQSGGSFLQNGTLTAASTKAERNVPAANWADPNSGWHQIASPVTSQAINGDWTPSGAAGDYDFYAWDEPNDLWLNQKDGANSITTFNSGQGYMVAYENGGTKTFTGAFNMANVAKTLTNQGAGELGNYDAGANLLGNPYPVALTWESGWIPDGVQGTAYIWSGSAYTAIADGNPIPAMNGFMVLTTTDNNPITIPAASRAHNAQAWHKNTTPGIKLIANDLEAGSQQETHIKFNPQATEAYDLAYDAFYLSGFAPQLYTMADESALMVNSMPAMQEDTKIPLHFEKTEAENFSIQLAENSLSVPVYLKDLKLNTTVKLSEMMEYNFTAETGDSPERFEVFFSALGVDELTQAQAGAFVRNNNIVVYGLNGVTNIELYNLAGQLVYTTQANVTGQFEINAGLNQGMYIVKLSSQSATNSVKVFIR